MRWMWYYHIKQENPLLSLLYDEHNAIHLLYVLGLLCSMVIIIPQVKEQEFTQI